VEYVSGDHEHFEPGVELPLSETYCTAAADIKAAGSVTDPHEEGYDDIHVYQEFGIQAYLGTYIAVDGGSDRTFFFITSESRAKDFSADDHAFIQSIGQWVKYELERRQRERFLRESYAITSDPALSFEEKLERLLVLGCEWFDLEMAGVNYLTSWDGKFRLEKGVGLDINPEDRPVWTDPGEGCFCRQTITEDAPVGRVDVRGTDWTDDSIYQDFGLTSYLGTTVMSGSTPYGTLWFGSTKPRDRPFSDTERTFIDLIGQWVSYEIERREHQQAQQELYDIAADPELTFEEKLQAVLDLGCERFDMELGGIAIAEPDTDWFEVEFTNGDHDKLTPSEAYPLSETYCRVPASDGGTRVVSAPECHRFEGKLCYDQFGVRTYLGTYLEFDDAANRTFWFVSTESREDGFSEAERTFHHLMGQWVQHELEQRQYEQELEETIGQLQQSNDRLKQFAYAASHDLQEPLRMVSSYLQLLENRYCEDLDDQAQEYIDFAVDGADRMRAMVDDLLAYARVEQADGDFEPMDCNAILNDIVNDLQVQIAETDADVTVESLPTVHGDKEQLEQLFSNLVSNAIKYNESDPPRIEITAAQRDDHWEFAITDNGIGIDPDKTDRIFEVFKRLHHDDEYPGTGIGLSLCQEIVDNHGGDIRVESEPGEGSTFFVTLPQSTD
jgi:signal transduction histidine kinase